MDQKPTKVILGGELAQKWQPEYEFFVSSPAEAFRAIDVNTRGEFGRYMLAQGKSAYYQVAIGREDNALDESELTNRTGSNTIYILPVVGGAKSGVGKILAGIAIAVVMYIFSGAKGVIATIGYETAASLVLQGVVQIITPIPNFNTTNKSAEDTASTLFQGNSDAIAQGVAVPLVYGRMRVAPMPVSISFTATDRGSPNSFANQNYNIVYGPNGGIVDYIPIHIDPTLNLPPE